MPKHTKSSLAAENADLRRRIEMLEAVVRRLTMQPVTQFVPMPCPGPHYPAPTVVPYPFAPYVPQPQEWYGPTTICGGSALSAEIITTNHMVGQFDISVGCAVPTFLGTEAFEWNAGPGAIGPTS